MFNQIDFGKGLKSHRKTKNFTQSDVASKIGVSEQAVSKWEKGECLPDVYNLKLLSGLFRVSTDSLLEAGDKTIEKIIETIKIGEATFEIIDKPQTFLAGKILHAKDFGSIDKALESINETQRKLAFEQVVDCIPPVCDIHLSINFWKNGNERAFGFVREATKVSQPNGVDIYKMPASLYIRAYTDAPTSKLMAKQQCEVWELFAYIRNYFMPSHGFKMAENGAQEMEVFDTSEHKTGYAYMPVIKI